MFIPLQSVAFVVPSSWVDVPVGHDVQFNASSSSLYVPTWQCVHFPVVSSRYEPDAHAPVRKKTCHIHIQVHYLGGIAWVSFKRSPSHIKVYLY